jgi:endonuclease/exonuclease/phosphatase (EEP) superfamily protein YafD
MLWFALRTAAWAALAFMGWVAFSLAIGVTGPNPTVVLQALGPEIMAPAPLFVLLGLWRHWWAMLPVATSIFLMELIVVAPLVFHGSPPPVQANAPRFKVMYANLLYDDPLKDDEARVVTSRDVDMLALVELHPGELLAMQRTGRLNQWPYHLEKTSLGAAGVGLFSRFPFVSARVERLGRNEGIRAVVDVNGTYVNVFVVHPPAPVGRGQDDLWARDLAAIGTIVSPTVGPTLVIGDFNAAPWHPPLRDILSDGFHDSHVWLGRGFSRSWPMGRRVPPFVRLDHALVRGGVIPVDIEDIVIPGSDHKGFEAAFAVNR